MVHMGNCDMVFRATYFAYFTRGFKGHMGLVTWNLLRNY